MKGAKSAQKALCWRSPSRQSSARKRARLDSSHWLKIGDSLLDLIVTIPAQTGNSADNNCVILLTGKKKGDTCYARSGFNLAVFFLTVIWSFGSFLRMTTTRPVTTKGKC